MRVWKKELEEQQALLKFKLSTEMSPDTQADLKETKQILSDIKNKLLDINNQINVTDEHLNRITQIFESPEKHMTLTIEKLKLDHLGFELDAASTDRSDEFSIAEYQFGQAPKRSAIWVRIQRNVIS